VFVFAVLVHIAAYVAFARANAPTYDEGVHLAAGYRMWQCGNFAINPEHPPLAKFIAAAPIHRWPVPAMQDDCRNSVVDYIGSFRLGFELENGAASAEMFRKARLALLPFTLLLLLLLFVATREAFGPLAASIAVLLYVFEPSITAHAAPVTTDMAMTAFLFASVVCAWWWLNRPSWLRTLVLALTSGLAVTSKISGLIVPLIVLILLFVGRSLAPVENRPPVQRILLHWAVAGAISFVMLWGSYLFRFYAAPASTRPDYSLASKPALDLLLRHHWLPESYLAGYNVIASARDSVFLLGKVHPTGVWFYFPVAISIKTTLPLLLLIVASLLLIRSLWKQNRRAVLFAVIPSALYLSIAMSSPLNMGIRHILPIYPFLIALAAAGAAQLIQRSRVAIVVIVALLAWQGAAFVGSSPYHLSYANEAYGGRANLYKVLAVDWGEAAYLVTDWSSRNPSTPCLLAWLAPAMPRTHCTVVASLAGDAFELLPPPVPNHFQGDVLVSTTLYQDAALPYHATFPMPPSHVIEGSILVFSGDLDLTRLATFQHEVRAGWFLRHGQPTEAIGECENVDPRFVEPSQFQLLYGIALHRAGRDLEARHRIQSALEMSAHNFKLAAIHAAASNVLGELH
jgi:4-amino-4-deoxy-L-arabinose transferase-like glycosyltransferase